MGGIRAVATKDWYSGNGVVMPVAIAEIDGLGADNRLPAPDATVDSGCRIDLLAVNGNPISISITGSHDDAVNRRPLQVALCDGPFEIPAGDVLIETTRGRDSGIDLDRLALLSGPGGSPGISFPEAEPVPELVVTEVERTSQTVQVSKRDGAVCSGARSEPEPRLDCEVVRRNRPRRPNAGRRFRQWVARQPGRSERSHH